MDQDGERLEVEPAANSELPSSQTSIDIDGTVSWVVRRGEHLFAVGSQETLTRWELKINGYVVCGRTLDGVIAGLRYKKKLGRISDFHFLRSLNCTIHLFECWKQFCLKNSIGCCKLLTNQKDLWYKWKEKKVSGLTFPNLVCKPFNQLAVNKLTVDLFGKEK